MRRFVVTLAALMMIGGYATRAAAQNAGPYTIDGVLIPDAGVPTTTDPVGSVRELGAVNGTATKIGVINKATPPMLAFTNPNGQVDLGEVYLQTAIDPATGHQWLYFGWLRDANTGSGFISIEFQQSSLSSACVYSTTGIDFVLPQSTAETTLINTCNPWRNRQTGDFVIMWDQQGNGLAADDIKKRVFTCTGTAVPYNCTLGGLEPLGSVVADFSADGFKGEMAIDLTTDIFGDADRCLSFDNVLPGTVTGNSDTADYKDNVFATFPPVTNCGVLKVQKVTLDPTGNVFSDPNNPGFGYTVTKSGDSLRYDVDALTHPVDGAPPQISIVRPNSNTPAGPAIHGGETQTHDDLLPGSNYTLVENTPLPTPYQLVSIICTDATGAHNITAGGTYAVSVPNGNFTSTTCVITNQFVRTTPSLATTQSARVFLLDSVSITGLTGGALNQPTNATFNLYDNACTTLLGTATGTLVYANGGTTATASMATADAILVNVPAAGATFRWRVTYPGDTFNNAVTTPCTLETTTVVITFVDNGS